MNIHTIIIYIGITFAFGACVAIAYLLILNYTHVQPLALESNIFIRNIEIIGMGFGIYAMGYLSFSKELRKL